MSILFTPGEIGKLKPRNRLVMTPMHLGFCPRGEVTEQLVEFYRLRASGGVGLIIVGGCGIDRIGNAPGMPQLDDDRFIPGLRRLVDAIHKEGAKIVPQLYQAGRYARTGQPAVAPSPIASKLTGKTPVELTQAGIDDIISSFANAAKRAQTAGFDGVEILASAGYLISQFLSPLTNKRTDRYGGDLRARMTFGLEVIAAVRQAVGKEFPIIVRVAGNDFMPGSNTNTECQAFCKALEQAGVNAINVTGGWHETPVPQITMNVPAGAFAYLAGGVKQAVSIPVIACNRINNLDLAEEIVQEGKADFIGMARPLIADPQLPNKAVNGRGHLIRPCIGCNQGCFDNIIMGKPARCLVNAEAGRETELAVEVYTASGEVAGSNKADNPRRVLVIGAGAAGMEFARVAASKGHQVTIWEASEGPGGQLALAAAPPGRKDFLYFATYLANACKEAGVNISYAVKATPEDIECAVRQGDFDEVVIATGAAPITPPIPIDSEMKVVQAWDVLAGGSNTGKNVIIIGGGAVGVETALLLAKHGTIDNETLRFLMLQQAETGEQLHYLLTHGSKQITVLEMAKGIGRDIGASTRWTILADLKRHQVKCVDQTKVLEIRHDGVLVLKEGVEQVLPADTVIFAAGSSSKNELYQALQGKIKNLRLIGDAAKPRKVLDAIYEAYREASALV